MATNYQGSCRLTRGGTYRIDIVNYAPGFKPYGFVGSMPVVIGDKCDREKNDDPYTIQPGDTVLVKVNDFSRNCAFAKVERKCGTFLRYGNTGSAKLTGQSTTDARDAVSVPENGGGYCGVFTIVKRTKPVNPGGANQLRECLVRIEDIKKGKKGRYFAVTSLVDRGQERPLHREIYVSQWPPPVGGTSSWPHHSQSKMPSFDELVRCRIGVPRQASEMLFFGEDKRKTIATRGGGIYDASDMHHTDAVDEFYSMFRGKRFRIGLASSENIPLMRQGIEESVFDLLAEDLPVKSGERL